MKRAEIEIETQAIMFNIINCSQHFNDGQIMELERIVKYHVGRLTAPAPIPPDVGE